MKNYHTLQQHQNQQPLDEHNGELLGISLCQQLSTTGDQTKVTPLSFLRLFIYLSDRTKAVTSQLASSHRTSLAPIDGGFLYVIFTREKVKHFADVRASYIAT